MATQSNGKDFLSLSNLVYFTLSFGWSSLRPSSAIFFIYVVVVVVVVDREVVAGPRLTLRGDFPWISTRGECRRNKRSSTARTPSLSKIVAAAAARVPFAIAARVRIFRRFRQSSVCARGLCPFRSSSAVNRWQSRTRRNVHLRGWSSTVCCPSRDSQVLSFFAFFVCSLILYPIPRTRTIPRPSSSP